jgi:ABC-type bacteriocin/lantibiotic exporter with double-glycine peptidase domain
MRAIKDFFVLRLHLLSIVIAYVVLMAFYSVMFLVIAFLPTTAALSLLSIIPNTARMNAPQPEKQNEATKH